jgi:hypothetical protein
MDTLWFISIDEYNLQQKNEAPILAVTWRNFEIIVKAHDRKTPLVKWMYL